MHSELKKGTTFTITLEFPIPKTSDQSVTDTILKPQETKKLQPKLIQPTTTTTNSTHKLLLIDDDPNTHILLGVLLKDYSLTFATDVASALTHINKESFDLILTDLGLPDGSGTDIARAYRAQEKPGKHTPIFAVTAHGAEVEKECFAAGIDRVVTKGNLNKLSEQIQSALSGSGTDTGESEYFDPQQAFELLGEDLCELIQFWLATSLPEERTALSAAYEQDDWNKIQYHAHKLKGSSSYIGVKKLHQACTALENRLMFGGDQDQTRLFHNLMQCIDDTEQAVKDWFENNN